MLSKYTTYGCFNARVLGLSCGLLLATVGFGNSATDTANMTVQITIESSCILEAANTLTFTTATTPLTANIDNNTTIDVLCSSGTAFDLGLDGGVAADVAARTMVNGGEDVSYSLSSDSPGGTNWGNTVGTDTVSSTGTGSTQTFTVYGRVPTQITPPANTYTDTVLVTVTF